MPSPTPEGGNITLGSIMGRAVSVNEMDFKVSRKQSSVFVILLLVLCSSKAASLSKLVKLELLHLTWLNCHLEMSLLV